MSLVELVILLGLVAAGLTLSWIVVRRLFCSHDGNWQTRETVVGFGVPISEQRCVRCGQLRHLAGPVARREGAR